MMTVEPISLPEIIPAAEMSEFKKNFTIPSDCPHEVKEFIEAVANNLGDFEQIQKTHDWISGIELLLANMKEHNGEKIEPNTMYPIAVPYRIAVNHRAAMYRLYKKHGKQGLISYVKAKASPVAVPELLQIISKYVCK
jgi:hypothetical protein